MFRCVPFLIILLLAGVSSRAQNAAGPAALQIRDSLVKVAMADFMMRYPAIRPVYISTDIIGSGSLHSDLNKARLTDGKLRTVRSAVNLHFPITEWKKNSLSGSVNYTQQNITVNHLSTNPYAPRDFTNTKAVAAFTLNYRRKDTLLGRPVIYSAAVSALTNRESAVQQLSYLGMVVFPIKKTMNTSIQLGAEFTIDPTVTIPVLPVLGYWHRFENTRWELFADLPSRVKLRETLGRNLWANFSTEMSGNVAFYRFSNTYLPQNVSYSTLDLKSGPGLEYRYHQMMFGISGGLNQPLSSRLFERSGSARSYFIRNKNGAAPFLNFNISLLSF